MSKAKLLLVLAFVVVCAAGVVVGTAFDRQMRPPIPPVPAPAGGPFGLNLSPEQQGLMKKIWGNFDVVRHQNFEKRRQFDHDRRAAFEALLTPEQLEQYNKIRADFDAKLKELDDQTHHAADLAVTDSDKILTPEQRARFHATRDRLMHGGPPGMGGPGMSDHHPRHDRGAGDRHRPTSEPTTMPQGETL